MAIDFFIAFQEIAFLLYSNQAYFYVLKCKVRITAWVVTCVEINLAKTIAYRKEDGCETR